MDDFFLFSLALSAVFLAAGLVKGVTGMGLPTVAMGLLGSIMTPAAAAALLVVPSFVTNVWQLSAGHAIGKIARRFWTAMLGIMVGALACSSMLVSADPKITRVALGVTLILYAIYALVSPRIGISVRSERWLSPLIGLMTGLITGMTGVFAIPAVPYFQALNIEKDELVQTLGLSFTVSTVALACGLLWHGAYLPTQAGWSIAAIFPALVGMWLGQRIRARISARIFRRIFLLFLLVIGIEMSVCPLL